MEAYMLYGKSIADLYRKLQDTCDELVETPWYNFFKQNRLNNNIYIISRQIKYMENR